MPEGGRRAREQRYELYLAYADRKISIHQFRAAMKDLGLTDAETDIYIDGDIMNMDEEQLRSAPIGE